METLTLTLSCRRCCAAILSPLAVCQRCGPTTASSVRASMADAPAHVCNGCAAPLRTRQILKPAPATCDGCGASGAGWRDTGTGLWGDQPDGAHEDDGAWIEARFDANYSGELKSAQESILGARSYRLAVRDPRLRDVRKVARTPPMESEEGKEALRFDQLDGVTVVHRDAEVGPERMYSLTLHDVRLHEWDHASVEDEDADTAALVGRVWGRLYARLKPLAAQRTRQDERADAQAGAMSAGDSVSHRAGDAGRGNVGGASGEDDQAGIDGSTHGADRAGRLGPDTGFEADLAIGAARNAILQSSGPVAGGSAAGAAANAASATTASTGSAWAGPPGSAKSAPHPHPHPHPRTPSLWQRLAGAWQRVQPPGFFGGAVWLWLALLCGFLALVCRWPAVVGAVLLLMLLRFLTRARPLHALFPASRRRWNGLASLVAVVAAFWVFGMIARAVSVCADVPAAWFAVLAGLLLATGVLRRRLSGWVVGAIGLVALILVYHREPVSCGQTLAQAVRTSVTALPQRLAQNSAAEDRDAAMVAAQDAGARGRRISIEQALAHPHTYFDCAGNGGEDGEPYEIYVGESALFAFKQARLGAGSEPHLRKIADLIATNPQARVVLTGHSDKTGSALLNLRLSEQRAQSVADWLVQAGAATPEKIDVRGAGDREPVVDDPILYRLNRRVELRIDCSEQEASR